MGVNGVQGALYDRGGTDYAIGAGIIYSCNESNDYLLRRSKRNGRKDGHCTTGFTGQVYVSPGMGERIVGDKG